MKFSILSFPNMPDAIILSEVMNSFVDLGEILRSLKTENRKMFAAFDKILAPQSQTDVLRKLKH